MHRWHRHLYLHLWAWLWRRYLWKQWVWRYFHSCHLFPLLPEFFHWQCKTLHPITQTFFGEAGVFSILYLPLQYIERWAYTSHIGKLNDKIIDWSKSGALNLSNTAPQLYQLCYPAPRVSGVTVKSITNHLTCTFMWSVISARLNNYREMLLLQFRQRACDLFFNMLEFCRVCFYFPLLRHRVNVYFAEKIIKTLKLTS